MLKGKKIFITGGAGFLGRSLVSKYYADNEITIYSRDEAKHYFLKKSFPNIKCIIGDVFNKERLIKVSRGFDYGIFTASLKQIGACDENPEEALNTICHGALNSREACLENNITGCFISTDKACEPTTIYGACKLFAEQSFIINNNALTCARYGNVLNSTGSVIPLIKMAIENEVTLELFSEEMTRFFITEHEAIKTIEYGFTKGGGKIIIPKLRSFKIKDLFEIYSEFGLKFNITTPRISEKIHESLYSGEEAPRISPDDEFFRLSLSDISNKVSRSPYVSKEYVIDKENLREVLTENNLL